MNSNGRVAVGLQEGAPRLISLVPVAGGFGVVPAKLKKIMSKTGDFVSFQNRSDRHREYGSLRRAERGTRNNI